MCGREGKFVQLSNGFSIFSPHVYSGVILLLPILLQHWHKITKYNESEGSKSDHTDPLAIYRLDPNYLQITLSPLPCSTVWLPTGVTPIGWHINIFYCTAERRTPLGGLFHSFTGSLSSLLLTTTLPHSLIHSLILYIWENVIPLSIS